MEEDKGMACCCCACCSWCVTWGVGWKRKGKWVRRSRERGGNWGQDNNRKTQNKQQTKGSSAICMLIWSSGKRELILKQWAYEHS